MKTDIKSLTLAELQSQLAQMGQSSFRAGQVYAWLHRGAVTFGEMTDLPKALRESLDERYEITAAQVVRKQASQQDGTGK